MDATNITKEKGSAPGPTLAIFAGVHGNEKAGVLALEKVKKEVNIRAGTVYFVLANPKAIEQDVRFIEKNLNRCFLSSATGNTYEEQRARELMSLLDGCDALLDLHASNADKSTPFIICESNAYDIAKRLDFTLISSGWDHIEPGATDGYMYQQGKPGLCLECGSLKYSEDHVGLAEDSIYQFLQYFGCIPPIVSPHSRDQRFIQAKKAVIKRTEDFYLTKQYQDFDELSQGEIIAYEDGHPITANGGECTIFPDETRQVGQEAFILGEFK